MEDGLDRNLRLIPWHELLVRTAPWLAVFVLFTRAEFGLDGAIQLAGIYYLAVVVFEVPSGWASDRFGRVPTLRFAGAAWIGAFTCFLAGSGSFGLVAVGQALLALGYASLSGTDVTLHFDTLEALGRSREYPDRQARVASRGLVVRAFAAFAGGAVALVDLRWAFAASLALAIAQLAVALRFTEPPARAVRAGSLPVQVVDCVRYLRDGPLAWIFGYGIAMVVLEHVASTLLQPWLTVALDRPADDLGATPVLAGAVVGSTALVGAVFARASAGLGRRFGVRVVLVGLGGLSAVIVSAMAVSTHLAVIALIVFRLAQGSAAPVLISDAVASAVEPRHRATLLSLDSLAGRLAYGGLLLVVAADAADDVSRVLAQLAAVAWVLVAVTAVTGVLVSRREGSAPTERTPPDGQLRSR